MGKGGDAANALLLLCIVAFGSVETATPFITPVYVPDEIVIPDLIRGTNSMTDATPVKKAVTAYTSGYLNSYDSAFAAEHFDLVDTNFGLSPATLTAMKAANADLLVIGYKDLIAVKTTDADYGTVTMNEDWFLHDASANRIANTEYGWYLMDPASAGWRAHYVSQVNAAMAAGYDGVFADDCWDDVSDYQSGLTHTVQAADVASWHADMVAFLTYIKANITEGKIVVVNSDEWGDNTYVAVAGARMIEGYCHENWTPVDSQGGRSTSTIMTLVDRMVTDLAAGYTVWAHSGSLEGTNSQNAQMLQYCYACYLLGAGTGSYWGYRDWYESDGDGGHGYYALMDTDLGDASGAYASWSGLYKREFAKGLVLFNPSSSAVTVTVDAGYRNVYTGLIEGTSITVPAYGGAILYSPYTVTSSATTGGSVSPSGATTIAYGSSQVYTATESTGYFFNYWELDGSVYNTTNPLTYSGAAAGSAHTLKAYFTLYTPTNPQVYYVEAYAGQGGSVSPSGQTVVAYPAGSVNLTATASYGYTFKQWKLNGVVSSFNASITYSSGTPPNVYIFTAEFEADPAPTPTYTITALAGANGSITNSGVNVTAVGTAYTSLATADDGYIFSHWTRDASWYSTANPISLSLSQGEEATLAAVFIADTETPPDPDEPDPTPQPAPPTPSGRFNSLISNLERQTPDGSIWDSHVWVSGLWDKCVSYRTVERQQEKAPAV